MRKVCEFGRFILPKCGADKKEFLSAVYKKGTQAKKYRLDVAHFGRSMVEMLGVLAIIGVLSVGGIAGYSKAMLKQKINNSLEQISVAVARIVELRETNVKLDLKGGNYEKALGLECNEVELNADYYGCSMPVGIYKLFFGRGGGLIWEESLVLRIYLSDNNAYDMCTAFLSSKIYENVPEEWYSNDGSNICVSDYRDNQQKCAFKGSLNDLSYGPIGEISADDIIEMCAICEQACYINWNIY